MYVAAPSLPTHLLGSGTLELGLNVMVGNDEHVPTCLKHNKADPTTGGLLEIKAEFWKNSGGASDHFV